MKNAYCTIQKSNTKIYLLNSNDPSLEHRMVQVLDASVSLFNIWHCHKTKSTGLSCPGVKNKMNIFNLKGQKSK